VKQTKAKSGAIIQAERNQKTQPQQQKPPCNHYNIFIVQQLSRPISLSAHSDIFWISAYFGLLSGELSQSDEGFEEKRAHKESKSLKSIGQSLRVILHQRPFRCIAFHCHFREYV